MVVLTKLVVIISQYGWIYQITMLYTLNLSNVICQLCLNKLGGTKGIYLIVGMLNILESEAHPFFSQTEW